MFRGRNVALRNPPLARCAAGPPRARSGRVQSIDARLRESQDTLGSCATSRVAPGDHTPIGPAGWFGITPALLVALVVWHGCRAAQARAGLGGVIWQEQAQVPLVVLARAFPRAWAPFLRSTHRLQSGCSALVARGVWPLQRDGRPGCGRPVGCGVSLPS